MPWAGHHGLGAMCSLLGRAFTVTTTCWLPPALVPGLVLQTPARVTHGDVLQHQPGPGDFSPFPRVKMEAARGGSRSTALGDLSDKPSRHQVLRVALATEESQRRRIRPREANKSWSPFCVAEFKSQTHSGLWSRLLWEPRDTKPRQAVLQARQGEEGFFSSCFSSSDSFGLHLSVRGDCV